MNTLKQPLLHFLLLGALIFLAAHYLELNRSGVSAGSETIVSKSSFIEFVQYRHRGINRASAEQLVSDMSAKEKKTLLEQHIQEEVLYREAMKLGMDQKDYVIKQRLIQKMEYLLSDSTSEYHEPNAQRVEEYFSKNQQRYFEPARITFTHVFFDSDRHGSEQARRLAVELKSSFNSEHVPFENAARYGDRFVYFTNYVERNQALVASHFGDAFAKKVLALPANTEQWVGPIKSQYGEHLLLIAKRDAGKVPPLEKIYNAVKQDLASDEAQLALQAAVQKLAERYAMNIAELEGEI